MLAAISNSWPSITNGVSSVASRSCATWSAVARASPSRSASSSMNSSPPWRASRSVARVRAARRAETWRSSSSPDGVPERVVDELEVVEVDVEHRAGVAVAARAGERERRVLLELGAVGQAGQRVVVGHVLHVLLGGALLGDVLAGDQHHVAAARRHEAAGPGDPAPLAGAGDDRGLALRRPRTGCAASAPCEGFARGRAEVLGDGELEPVLARAAPPRRSRAPRTSCG